MTDNEIIETWKKIQDILKKTENVVLQKEPIDDLVRHITNILDLINRQKAEIERLRYNLEAVLDERADHSEAIKEFAEKASKLICDNTYPDFDKDGKAVNIWSAKDGYKQIDNLVKEMVGDNCGV